MKWLSENAKRAAVPALTVAFGILLYELLEHFAPVREAASALFRVAAPIVYGLCLAYVLNLPMSFFENRVFFRLKAKKPALARAFSILITFSLLLGTIALVAALVVPKVTDGVVTLINNLGDYLEAASLRLESLGQELKLSPEAYAILSRVKERLSQRVNELAVGMVPMIPGMTKSAVNVVYCLIVTLVLSIHGLIMKERLLGFARRAAEAILPRRHAGTFFRYCTLANRVFRRYITGQTVSCLILGGLCYIGMRIFGMPYAELIAVFIAAAAFIPIIGPWVSTICSALIILVSRLDDPWLALWFVLIVITVQLFDDNLIAPRIVGDAIGVPGMLVLAAIVTAGGLFGIGGLIVAVPTAAVIYKIFGDWVDRRNKERPAV